MEMLPVYIVLGAIALVIIWIIAIYNGLVAKRQTVNEAFSGIDVQLKLRREGYRMRVYVPFGTHWYPYLMRRLAERPANLAFVAGNVWRESFGRR